MTPTLSPALVGTPFLVTSVKTSGDYAALFVESIEYTESDAIGDGNPYLLVVQLSTWQAWHVEAEQGAVIQVDGWTLTPEHLYFGTTGPGANDAMRLRSLTRVPLAKLGSFGTAL